MEKVLFKGVKQFTSDVWEQIRTSDEVKHYLNLVRKVDDHGDLVEGQAQVWFGTRLYADLGGEELQNLTEIVNNIINAIGTDSAGTINYNSTTYVTCATTVNEAIEMLDSALTQNIENIYELIEQQEVQAGPGIVVTPGGVSGSTVAVKLAADEQVLSFLPTGELHGEVRLKKLETDDDHLAAQYWLVDKDDNPIVNSATIDILRDQFLRRVLLTPVFESQDEIDEWCEENNIPDSAHDQMEVNDSYLVFEWDLDHGDVPYTSADTYTVIPVKQLISAMEIVINGVSATTESGVTYIEITADDIAIDRDIEYLEYRDEGTDHTAVAVYEGTNITDAIDIVLNMTLLYIDGNDVE